MIVEGHIADNAKADKGNAVEMAGMGDRTTFHIYRLCFGKVFEDAAHLFFRVDKPVTAYNQSVVNGYCCIL